MKKIIFAIIIFCFLAIRLFNLDKVFNFGSDQGIQLLEIRKLYNEKKISLIGPYSSFNYQGKHFFFGPAPYYIPMPILTAFNWQPISVSYMMVFIHFFGFVFLVSKLNRTYGARFGAIYGLLFTFFPSLVFYSRFLWNPNFLAAITSLALIPALDILNKKKAGNSHYLWLGILLGFGMQFHFSFFLTCGIIFVTLLVFRKINPVNTAYIFSGFCIGFLPLIIFELRHDYYNSGVILKLLSTRNESLSGIGFQDYYLVSVWPVILLISAGILGILRKKIRNSDLILSAVFISVSMIILLPFYRRSFRMKEGWSYNSVARIAEIIVREKSISNFNIIDMHTGDTRAMALRYLLTIKNTEPLKVEDYPATDELFLYTDLKPEVFLKDPLWELKSAGPWKTVSEWDISNEVKLYKLHKINPPNSF